MFAVATVCLFLLFVSRREIRNLLGKYGTEIPWVQHNNIFLMVRKFKDLINQKKINEDDAKTFNFAIKTIKVSMFIIIAFFCFSAVFTFFMEFLYKQ